MAQKSPTRRKSTKNKSVKDYKKLFVIAFVALFAGIGGYFVFASRAAVNVVTNAPAPPAIYFSPTSQAIGANETITVLVRENSGTAATNAVQANFSYPTALLDYVPTTAQVTTDNPQGINFTGSAFSVAAEAKVDTVAGAVKIARGAAGGTSLTGDQLIATLTFKAKTTGGSAALTFTTGTALVASAGATNLLTANSYGNATYTIDTTGPAVSITAPAAGATISLGASQNITATATDTGSAVTKVEFYIDNVLASTDTTSPYAYNWATTGVSEGSHSITAKGYDSFNNVTTSSAVSVTVRDSTAPTVSITAPAAGATVSGTISITANAADNTGGKGMSKVEFYVDGALKGTDTTSPYTYSWDTTLDTDATHSLTAKAYDAAAVQNVATSAAVSVTVDNRDKTPPTAPPNLRSTGNTFTSVALAWDASTDNVGVTGYRLTRNGTQVYSGTALTFNDTGLAEGTSYSYAVTAFDAQGNVSPATTISASSMVRTPGDINGDLVVNVFDLSILLTNWGTTTANCDLNKDGSVNVFDLSILLSNWS